jgi:hypothetical protein
VKPRSPSIAHPLARSALPADMSDIEGRVSTVLVVVEVGQFRKL